MKAHTNKFKTIIKDFGRELDSIITYTIDGTTTELSNEQLNSVTPHYEGAILKSVMKQLDIDSNVEIPVGTELNYQFGVKTRYNEVEDYKDNYDYIDYGNYIVKEVEKQEDTRSYKMTCYDKMLYAMKEYENSGIVFPITIRDYINAICSKLNLTFANANDYFANYNKTIDNELYLDENGKTLGYTFRDVLDELAQVTASTICISNDDKLEIRYVNDATKNLIHDATVSNDTNNYWSNYTTFDETEHTLVKSTGQTTATYVSHLIKNRLKKNTTYTLSLYAKSNGKVKSMKFSLESHNTSNIQLTTDYQKYTWTFTTNNSTNYNNATLYIYNNGSTQYNVGAYLTIKNVMLEEGYSASDYDVYGETINEMYLKNVNVNFGEKYGPINTIVLSRSADSDKVALSNPTDLADDQKIAIQISDNQIMNGLDRSSYLTDILNRLYGLEYYINDFTSTGICYLELCDRYNIEIENNTYKCIMFNNEINITQGLQELIYTDMPDDAKQNYDYISDDDRKTTQAYIIAKKNEGTILEVTQALSDDGEIGGRLHRVETTQTATDRTISVISQNIDFTYDADGNPISSEVNSVTTTEKRFTFNDSGLNIASSDNNFKSTIDETGVFFEENGNPVAQYTKDGSKQKDLSLFGVYYYGMDDIDDTPMFVAELYTDENGEECFGHFYNRGD